MPTATQVSKSVCVNATALLSRRLSPKAFTTVWKQRPSQTELFLSYISKTSFLCCTFAVNYSSLSCGVLVYRLPTAVDPDVGDTLVMLLGPNSQTIFGQS